MCSHSIVISTQICIRHRSHGPYKRVFAARLNLMTLLPSYISYLQRKKELSLALILKGMCTLMFMETLFIIAEIWKQPKHLTTGNWINKVQYKYILLSRSNQSILKEISPGCSLEGLMLKLNLQYFGYLMRRADSFEKTLMLGKIKGRRRRDDRG